jgi:putative ABC transport system permease protein
MNIKLRDFRVGWRVLVKEPAYSAVVIFGLAVGIAVCFLLLGLVRHSFSYDRQVPERERVYQLMERWNLAVMGNQWFLGSSMPSRTAALRSGQPVLVTAFHTRGVDVRVGATVASLEMAMVDPDFEKIFQPKVLAGDLHAALTRPEAVALTRETAVKLFGTVDAVGKTLQSDKQSYTVAAVVADQPAATTMTYSGLAGLHSAIMPPGVVDAFAEKWGGMMGRVYVKLLPGADKLAVLDAVRQGLRNSPLVKRDYADQVAALGGRDLIDFKLTPITDVYLDPAIQGMSDVHGNLQAIYGLSAVALLILGLAATNYVNLATVRTLARQREIAVRKVLGASSTTVARQFLAESVLVCLIATGLGLLLAWLLLPVFSNLVQRTFDHMFSPTALLAAGLFGVLLGLAAGAYPAWSALRVRATAALAGRGGSETPRGLWLRRALTTLQFAAAMGLTGTTLAVAWQTQYASSLSPGFNPAPLVMFGAHNNMTDPRMRGLREALLHLPGVEGVAESSNNVFADNNITTVHRDGGTAADLMLRQVSPEFFGVYGLKPVAGRLFDPSMDTMTHGDRVVVNESAARQLGFATAQDAVGKTISETGDDARPAQIVGVVTDLRNPSARGANPSSVFYLSDHLKVFTVRSTQDPASVMREIQDLWPRFFPNETQDAKRMETFITEEYYADDLRLAKLLAASSVIAIAIAAFGIYVLAAYSVQRRTREIVLRKLYGAGQGAIGSLVLREFATLIAAGALIGLPAAWLATQRYLAPFNEHAPIGLWTLVAALIVAGLVTLASTLRHTLAAVRIRPALALRE